MESKYIGYSIEQFADDERFIAWVIKGENNNLWEEFLKENSDLTENVKQASEIILLLQDTSEDLGKKDEFEMWNNIEKFSKSQEEKGRILKIRRSLYWAASFLVILSIGTLSYFYISEGSGGYEFLSSDTQLKNNDVKLLLSSGEEISLKTKNSKFELNNENELLINNDSIIDLSLKGVDDSNEIQMNEIVVPYGKKSELILADGTKVWLNAGTHFAFPTSFIDDSREVFLEGEAYFEVVENMDKPFIVNVNKLNIRVLGTSFNVSAYPNDDRIETILLTGSVVVGKSRLLGQKRDDVIIKPYQKASFNKQDNEVVVSNEPNADSYITWTEGMFQFSKESLQSVLTKLERFYNVSMSFPENFQSSELISGKLDLKESIADVMMVLGDVAKIEYRINENIIYVDKKK